MAESPTTKRAGSPKAESNSVDDIEGVLGRVRYFLCLISERPLEDADAIKCLVDECRSAHIRSERSSSQPQAESQQMLKDELMPESRAVSTTNFPNQPDPSPELKELLFAVVDDPETWLSTPSMQFGGRRPGDLIGTDEEPKLFDLLNAVDQGLF